MTTYLDTLMRIPDDVILAMGTREFDMWEPSECVCGWALREGLARAPGYASVNADDVNQYRLADGTRFVGGTVDRCVGVFGGRYAEWNTIFGDAVDRPDAVELAFVKRFAIAATRS